jgi:hypothetical protein
MSKTKIFKSVIIKRSDTCLTYILKRLGLFDIFNKYDVEEFIKLFHLDPICDLDNLNKGDVIIVENKKHYYVKKKLIIDEHGRTFSDYVDNSYHFMVCEGDAISDYGNEGIGYYLLDFFKINNLKYKYFVISYSQLVRKRRQNEKEDQTNS